MSTSTMARQEVACGEVSLRSRQIPYRVVRSRRARLIHLRMLDDGAVEIAVPPRMPVPPVEALLESKQRWICRQLDRLDALPPVRTDHVDFLGNEYRVMVTRHDGATARITMLERTVQAELPDDVDAAPVIEAFFRKQARAILGDRVRLWADVMHAPCGSIAVRDQRTRWGSCSTKGGLSFSWRLVMAPLPVLDYVVIHELMHVREMNHSRQFWEGVARYCPEYQHHRAWLRANGVKLARPMCLEQ